MSHTRVFGRLIVCVVLLFCFGCAHEKMIGSSESMPPFDRLTPPPPSDGNVYFIGRSLAVNILDERHGVNAAKDDAAFEIAKEITRGMDIGVEYIDSRKGDSIRGQDRTDQTSKDTLTFDVSVLVSGVRQLDAYWERWSVREKFLGEEFKRYRHYVLVSFPENELEYQRELLKKKSRQKLD